LTILREFDNNLDMTRKMKMEEPFSTGMLRGKVTLITGGGRGLGKTMALALARAGSDIVLVARTQDEIDRTEREIRALGRKGVGVRADVTSSDQILKMAEKVHSEFGKIDVLINNAGQNASYVHHKFEEIPEEEWVRMIQINVNGVFLVTQIVGRIMLARSSGKIINVGSSMGIKAVPERLCYCVSKAALIQMTRGLALEWAPRGVTVNCIAPGSFDRVPDSKDEAYLKMNEERKKRIPLGRLGRLEELGPLIVYLASDASNYMTGQTIFLDGGLTVG
jgi:NAD(P)-dependent dehydrogenase (short-subunit alcohol dehydrogenase family)